MKSNNWFVYAHYLKRTKGNPFYIGIGCTKDRMFSIKNRNLEWLKETKLNKGFSTKILFSSLTKEEAFCKEKELIKKYGRIDSGTGCLTNKTSGGQGNNNPSDTTRYRIGTANRGRKFSEEHKLKLSLAKKGKPAHNKGVSPSEATKEKIRKARKHQIFTEETRRKLSIAASGRRPKSFGDKIRRTMLENIFEMKMENLAKRINNAFSKK